MKSRKCRKRGKREREREREYTTIYICIYAIIGEFEAEI